MKNLLTKKTPLALLLAAAVLSQYGCGEDKKKQKQQKAQHLQRKR